MTDSYTCKIPFTEVWRISPDPQISWTVALPPSFALPASMNRSTRFWAVNKSISDGLNARKDWPKKALDPRTQENTSSELLEAFLFSHSLVITLDRKIQKRVYYEKNPSGSEKEQFIMLIGISPLIFPDLLAIL